MGTLIEIISGSTKLICNSGFYFKEKNKLNMLSKSTAAHSTLYLDNCSSCMLKKKSFYNNNYNTELLTSLKIQSKRINVEKEFDQVIASHDGYQKKYGFIHERKIQFFKNKNSFVGEDILIAKKQFKKVKFGIRFHIYPETKIVKTQEKNTILLSSVNGEGWKFNCADYEVFIENGIFLGNKNKLIKNENIFISDITHSKNQSIKWSFEKIS